MKSEVIEYQLYPMVAEGHAKQNTPKLEKFYFATVIIGVRPRRRYLRKRFRSASLADGYGKLICERFERLTALKENQPG